jgi:hypothetical protein
MLHYSNHAKRQMRRRGITEQEVEYCLQNYDITYPGRAGATIYKGYVQSGKRIKVVINDSTEPKVIITAATT